MSIRSMAKKIIDYTIEDNDKVYRLKGTPFRVKFCFTKKFQKNYGQAPVLPNKIVFENYFGGGFGCNSKYVLSELLKRPECEKEGLDLVWITSDVEKNRHRFPKGVRLVEYGSQQALFEFATAKVWVRNFHMVHYIKEGLVKKPGQVFIQMWHGSFGIKKIEASCEYLEKDSAWTTMAKRSAAMTDYWISNSQFESEVYREAFWGAGPILSFGHPRNDLFFHEEDYHEKIQKIRDKYGLTNEKIVLYMPTYRDDGKLTPVDFSDGRILQSLEKRFGGTWKCAQRLHPRFVDKGAVNPGSMKGVNHSDKASKQQGDLVFSVSDYPDPQELLLLADAVITDYSSAIFDFMLTGRPGFLLAEDYEEYEKMRGFYYPLKETPFPVAKSISELVGSIEVFDDAAYRDEVKAFLEAKGSVEDGSASKRVVDFILKEMDIS